MMKSSILAGAFVGMLAVSPVFASPAAAQNRNQGRDDHGQQRQDERRVHDEARGDDHNWNTDEDRQYREFLKEHHRKYREFARLNKKQQNEYWQWRHDHEGHGQQGHDNRR
jgi:hypothetical protein